jgi:hypothetical protein
MPIPKPTATPVAFITLSTFDPMRPDNAISPLRNEVTDWWKLDGITGGKPHGRPAYAIPIAHLSEQFDESNQRGVIDRANPV